MSRPNVTDEQIRQFLEKLFDKPATRCMDVSIERNDRSIIADAEVRYKSTDGGQ